MITPMLFSLFALVNALPVKHPNTCCLKCKCRSLFVGQASYSESVCACWPDRERHWKTEIRSPLLNLVQPVMQVCVCGNAWVYSPLKPELTRSWVAAAERVSTDKRIWVSTILLFDSDITMSFCEPRQQGDVGGGIRGNWENKTGVVDCQSGARGRWRLITEKRLEQQQKNARLRCRWWKQQWIREHIVLEGCCYL